MRQAINDAKSLKTMPFVPQSIQECGLFKSEISQLSRRYEVLTTSKGVFLASVRLCPMKTKPRMMLAMLATSDM
jgi:hypothetical protein